MTGINWCDSTWNPVRGCSRVSEGCRHCYAEQMAARIVRMGRGKPSPYDGLVKLHRDGYAAARWTGKVVLDASKLADPLRWRKPRRMFVNSMSDLFHESLSNEQIAAVFGVMAAAPQHTFQVLTKRARRMREWFEWVANAAAADGISPSAFCFAMAQARGLGEQPRDVVDRARAATWPLPNVWLGVSVENQDAADERIPELLATPAAVRWLSCEPLLGLVRLTGVRGLPSDDEDIRIDALEGTYRVSPRDEDGTPIGSRINWVVAGCESGPGARPAQVAWFRSLRDQCANAGVAFWLKQAREHTLDRLILSDGSIVDQVGVGEGSKRKPGGIIDLPYLDGVQHAAMPKGGL